MKAHKLYRIVLAFSLIISSNVYANNHLIKLDFDKGKIEAINRASSFELDIPPEKALLLFTAQGEKLWAPGWQPNMLNGEGYEEGDVWITQREDSTTYWYVSKYDTLLKKAVYTFVTPDLLMGTVHVVLTENGNGGSLVKVTYNLTALSNNGNHKLKTQYSSENYPKMIAQWKTLIMNYLDKIQMAP
jgi:hypothetical protein